MQKICSHRKEVQASESLKKGDKWESWKQMLDRFDETELNQHIASGRVIYREDPVTWGLWQYKDTQDWSRELNVGRGKRWEQGQEWEPEEEDLEKFSQLYTRDAMGLGLEDISDVGLGKGKCKGLGKGKGKGKKGLGKGALGKGKGPLAIEDGEVDGEELKEEEPTEEEALKEALKKARKARDQVVSTQHDLEEALGKAKAKLSKQGQATAEGLGQQLQRLLVVLKGHLGSKKQTTSAALGKVLQECAETIKGAKEEAKELKQLANRASSVAPSKRSKK